MWAPYPPKNRLHSRRGFTIVELLIVIVVIGILAAITIVAFNGVQQRAKASAAQSFATQANKKVVAYAAINNDLYPTTLAAAEVYDANGTTFQYTVNNLSSPRTYGITATNGTVSYWVSNSSSAPATGAYQGHGIAGNPSITNLVINTSLEGTDINTLQNIGNPTARDVSRLAVSDAYNGATVFRVKSLGGGNLGGYGSMSTSVPVGTYIASMWVRSNSAAISVVPYLEGTATKVANSAPANPSTTVSSFTPNVWKRIQSNFSVTAAGTVKVGFLTSGTIATNDYVDVDGFMLTAGPTSYVFADGATDNWIWSGTPNLSTSTGSGTPL